MMSCFFLLFSLSISFSRGIHGRATPETHIVHHASIHSASGAASAAAAAIFPPPCQSPPSVPPFRLPFSLSLFLSPHLSFSLALFLSRSLSLSLSLSFLEDHRTAVRHGKRETSAANLILHLEVCMHLRYIWNLAWRI
jgi:hypothetical protein